LDAGAELFDSTHVLEPIVEKGYVKGVETRSLKDETKTRLTGTVTVDASGMSAIVRSKMPPEIGLENNVQNEDTEVCYREIRETKKKVEEPDYCEIFLDLEKAPGGYYWIFPAKQKLTLDSESQL
jgi:flavin-dependent dehydrogenase